MKKAVLLELITIYKNYKSTNCYEKYENKSGKWNPAKIDADRKSWK